MAFPIIVQAAPAAAFGSFEGVLIASWRTEVQLADVKALVAYRDELATLGLRGAIHMAEEGLPLPSPEVRRLATAAVSNRTDVRPAIALVTFGTGFAASAIRAAASAMFSLRSGPPTRWFGSTGEASAWLTSKSATGVDPRALQGACDAVRQAGLSSEVRSGVYVTVPSAAEGAAASRTRS